MEYWVVVEHGEPRLVWLDDTDSGGKKTYCIWSLTPSGSDLGLPTEKCNVREAISQFWPKETPVKYPIERGSHHPRIWRQNDSLPLTEDDKKAIASTESSFGILLEMLEYVFQSVEPEPRNMACFGQRLRQLLMIACMDVEASWAGILKANGYVPKGYLTRKDYQKLAKPMRLNEWSLRLTLFPGYPEIRPFEGWGPGQSAQELKWYDAYNAVKHDREENLWQSSLGNVISAVAGVLVLALAQFGGSHWSGTALTPGSKQQGVFRISSFPKWAPEEHYYPPQGPKMESSWISSLGRSNPSAGGQMSRLEGRSGLSKPLGCCLIATGAAVVGIALAAILAYKGHYVFAAVCLI